jgi:hypothetical protein
VLGQPSHQPTRTTSHQPTARLSGWPGDIPLHHAVILPLHEHRRLRLRHHQVRARRSLCCRPAALVSSWLTLGARSRGSFDAVAGWLKSFRSIAGDDAVCIVVGYVRISAFLPLPPRRFFVQSTCARARAAKASLPATDASLLLLLPGTKAIWKRGARCHAQKASRSPSRISERRATGRGVRPCQRVRAAVYSRRLPRAPARVSTRFVVPAPANCRAARPWPGPPSGLRIRSAAVRALCGLLNSARGCLCDVQVFFGPSRRMYAQAGTLLNEPVRCAPQLQLRLRYPAASDRHTRRGAGAASATRHQAGPQHGPRRHGHGLRRPSKAGPEAALLLVVTGAASAAAQLQRSCEGDAALATGCFQQRRRATAAEVCQHACDGCKVLGSSAWGSPDVRRVGRLCRSWRRRVPLAACVCSGYLECQAHTGTTTTPLRPQRSPCVACYVVRVIA